MTMLAEGGISNPRYGFSPYKGFSKPPPSASRPGARHGRGGETFSEKTAEEIICPLDGSMSGALGDHSRGVVVVAV